MNICVTYGSPRFIEINVKHCRFQANVVDKVHAHPNTNARYAVIVNFDRSSRDRLFPTIYLCLLFVNFSLFYILFYNHLFSLM